MMVHGGFYLTTRHSPPATAAVRRLTYNFKFEVTPKMVHGDDTATFKKLITDH
jgi:hypothetical protein